ncbi:MAG TPA: hypothetical protein PLO21_12115 [Mesotoga sp.]|nr:hypothetical protein [Mesotoga sp.]
MWKIPEGEDETPDKRIVGNDYRYAPTFDDSSEKEAKIGATNAKGESVEDTFKTRLTLPMPKGRGSVKKTTTSLFFKSRLRMTH